MAPKKIQLDEDGFPIVSDSATKNWWREHTRIARMTDDEIDAVLAQSLPPSWTLQTRGGNLDAEP